ncbi:hypothetical protein ICHIJ1_13960 [Fluviibacter phosphoraccumulans]|uniref:restriction endonuclease n=1 Tax=Fluviibacter phosphoraccumulans TaxID=1751046 RepID=UPI0013676EBC|nr:restriction endonuclease [Fluviibacter phosphoraccumulans]BBU71477.1 hypothetical protein ICHIJ1_13960 [Fluviibacter phosphoraccumulans]
MDWKQYEADIYQHFSDAYPDCEVKANVMLPGRYSKANRQVDILISRNMADFEMRVVIDAKHYSRPIDVKDVECFLGYCADLGVSKGVMIAPQGYTPAALNRAFNDESDTELDVLNYAELGEFQGQLAIPYAGDCGVILLAPMGWVVDAERRTGMIAALYQRGRTFEDAGKAKEFAYVNIWAKNNDASDVDSLIRLQNEKLISDDPHGSISMLSCSVDAHGPTRIRCFESSKQPASEYTGFVEFDRFIFFCVMYSPTEVSKRNLRKMRSILRNTLPIYVRMSE